MFGLQAQPAWYLLVGQLGLFATPVAFFEVALHGRRPATQTLGVGSLLILLTGAGWLLFAQTVYAQAVFEGEGQAGALRTTLEYMALIPPSDLLWFLFPLSLPFAGSCWLELRKIRRRWQPFVLLICLPPAMIILGQLRAGHGNTNSLILTTVLACSLLIPIANAAAGGGASYWQARRGD